MQSHTPNPIYSVGCTITVIHKLATAIDVHQEEVSSTKEYEERQSDTRCPDELGLQDSSVPANFNVSFLS